MLAVYTRFVIDYGTNLSEESLEFCANVEKHLQNSGAVNRFLAHIVFVGLPGSGKTTLIARLLNLKGVDEMLKASGSTGIMDGIVTVDVTEDEASMHAANIIGKNCKWQGVEFGLSCVRQMGMKYFVVKQTPEDHTHASPPEATDSEAAPLSKGSLESPPTKLTPVKQMAAKQTAVKQAAKQSPPNVMATVQKLLQKLLRKEGFSAVRLFLDNKTSLYLSDTGW